MIDFSKKENFIKLKNKMLNKLWEALDDEPNAQIFKLVKDIIECAGIEMLEEKKDKSKLLSIINKKAEAEILDEIANQ